MKPLFCVLSLVLFLTNTSFGQDECNGANEARVRTFLKNLPKQWTSKTVKKQDIYDFICSETLVTAIIDCLERADLCSQVEGLGPFVDEIYARIDDGNNCPTCDPQLMDMIRDSVRTVQKRFPKQYIRGLSLF
ncbi:hypothetical protein Anas_06998 [Armadillidium nasatum]|uniref:Saposin B-type domain-containing protein n=1 Tax=Armadillidium nasatum TaxID=96803 RepID=A0A5N5SPK0_9CRUS|nr:hypothetical protein Anas_06998 [Armadillidium nasatum]